MPTYPVNLPIALSNATVDYDTDRRLERASNGSLRARVFFTSAKRKFSVSHQGLDATAKGTFYTFYGSNLYGSFSFKWPQDGVTYTCVFGSDPKEKSLGGGLISIDVDLLEV